MLINAPSGNDNGIHDEPEWFKKERGYTNHEEPDGPFNVREDLAERRNHLAEQPVLVRELNQLLDVILALDADRFIPRLGHRRQQQRRQDRDNRDHHQQLDQGEAPPRSAGRSCGN